MSATILMILYQVCGVVSVVEWRKGLGCVLSSVGNDRGYNSSWSRVISLIGPGLRINAKKDDSSRKIYIDFSLASFPDTFGGG